jgi:septum formation protein
MHEQLILASASPRRKELLGLLNLEYSVVPSGVKEEFVPGLSVREHALGHSRSKALSVSVRFPQAWVLGADTIVVVDEKPLGKPRNREEAKGMLRELSGKTHSVITGYAVARDGRIAADGAVVSEVIFREIPDDEMEWYLSTGEPFDKAGGYAVQGASAFFIREIRGSYTNVIGLPLSEVAGVLKRLGVIRFG